MKNLDECDICGESDFEDLYSMSDKTRELKTEFRLVKCKKCGVFFLNPQPSQKELEAHYEGRYYSLNGISLKSSKKVSFRIFLYNLYFNNKNKNFLGKLFFLPFVNYLRGTEISRGKKLLDIGSGSGQFIYEMNQLGMEVTGVEPGNFDEESSKKNGLSIYNSDLISASFPKDYFDTITLNQVLEHVSNPSKTLDEIYRILRRRGTFILGVPNNNSLAYKLFKENWYQLDVPRHLFHFSNKNLIKFLQMKGFRIKKVRYNSRPSQFTKSFRYFLGGKGQKRWESVLEFFLLPFTYMLNILKKGDSIEVWCTK